MAAVAAAVATGLMLWLMPDRSLSSRGPEQAEAPGFGLVYEPPALFPAYYLPPSLGPRASGLGTPFDSEAAWMPGETVAMNSIVTLAVVERSEVVAAEFAPGRVDLPIPPITTPEARSILLEAGWPAEWLADALTIGACESSGGKVDADGQPLMHPGEVGDSGNSLGWLQLWWGWFGAAGEDVERWWDPLVNARVGLYVRQVRGHYGGRGGWSCADRNGIP